MLTITIPAVAQSPPAPVSDGATRAQAAVVQDELEDVLVLESLQSLRLTDAQWQKVFSLARGVRDRLRQADADEVPGLLRLKESVTASRQRLVDGGKVAATTQEQLRLARESAIQRRTRLEADLVRATSDQLAHILAPTQMEVVYSLTRGVTLSGVVVSPLLQSNAVSGLRAGRPPEQEYQRARTSFEEDMKAWREHGRERDSLMEDALVGIPSGTTEYAQLEAQVSSLLDQARTMPHDAYQQRLDAILDRLTRAHLAGRQRQARAKYLAAKSPAEIAQWLDPFVRRVFFSPRVVPALEARLGQPSQ
jgi:hypothetical protein